MATGSPKTSFRKAFGPGLMWAAAAIGISHLVQSTRAGAMAGFGLAGAAGIAALGGTATAALAGTAIQRIGAGRS